MCLHQLTQIDLQNRQSLELENRGGARTNTDQVDILAIHKVAKSVDDGLTADVVWTVSGSVSHFGHIHYRRNKNHAMVSFIVDDASWKIKDLVLIEEKRMIQEAMA